MLTGLCASDVPCGRLADIALGKASVKPAREAEETSVSKVATKLSTGEVDAGFIYTTDARKIQGSTLIELANVPTNKYPMALTEEGKAKSGAAEFSQWLTSEQAQKILASYGFDKA